ncbi:MAG: hypothetical protein K2W96_06690 [Gemmataceae bacterium]|nr:hypothetical protein [Gemmataceae bacterium]
MSQQPGLRASPDRRPSASGPMLGGTDGGWMESAQRFWPQAVLPWAAWAGTVALVVLGLFLTAWRFLAASGHDDWRLLLGAFLLVYAVVGYPMWAGGLGVALRVLRGEPWTFGDFLSFLPRYGAHAALGAFFAVLAALAVLPYELWSQLYEQGWTPDFSGMTWYPMLATAGLLMALLLAWLAGVAYLHVRFVFAGWFVEDRRAGPAQALAESWKLTAARAPGVFWLCYDTGLMLLLGFVPLAVGFAFMASLATLAHGAAFLHGAGEHKPA